MLKEWCVPTDWYMVQNSIMEMLLVICLEDTVHLGLGKLFGQCLGGI